MWTFEPYYKMISRVYLMSYNAFCIAKAALIKYKINEVSPVMLSET